MDKFKATGDWVPPAETSYDVEILSYDPQTKITSRGVVRKGAPGSEVDVGELVNIADEQTLIRMAEEHTPPEEGDR